MMKRVKSALALILALLMVLALGTSAFAAEEEYSITVTNSNKSISIDGKTYSAYKIFDATYDGDNVAYTVSTEFEDFEYKVDKTSYTGKDLINYLERQTSNSEVMDAFAKAALEYATNEGIAAAGTAFASGETATISLSEAGYYVVSGTAAAASNKQEVTAACALTTAKPTASVTVKADVPSVDKKIVEGEKRIAANSASIGDSVNYEITSKVPAMTGYVKYFFVMQDTLSKGLTYNDNMTVKVGDTTLVANTGYTVKATKNTTDGTTSIEIVFKDFINYKTQEGAAITVNYSATVNQDASLSPVEGNINEVKLVFSNNPNEKGTGDPDEPDKPGPSDPVGETPVAKTKTFVTGLKLKKIDGKTNKKLTGAKFEIKGDAQKVVLINKEMFKASDNGDYYMLKDGTYTNTIEPITDKTKEGYNADKFDSVTQKYEKVTVVDKTTEASKINTVGYVDENGVLKFEGLNQGTYTITELVSPSGYNLLKTPITIKITANATLDGCTWTVQKDGVTLSTDTEDTTLYVFDVANNSGKELPTTGGIGTTIFYVLGAVLVLGAGVVLITRKRMSKER
jgi:fimbrial isopeptide formation D2 family protein/LPXTG-motif cell wall-anchored protein